MGAVDRAADHLSRLSETAKAGERKVFAVFHFLQAK